MSEPKMSKKQFKKLRRDERRRHERQLAKDSAKRDEELARSLTPAAFAKVIESNVLKKKFGERFKIAMCVLRKKNWLEKGVISE